jgi:hypothetical protein
MSCFWSIKTDASMLIERLKFKPKCCILFQKLDLELSSTPSLNFSNLSSVLNQTENI